MGCPYGEARERAGRMGQFNQSGCALVLQAPWREMLKEILVRACQSRSFSAELRASVAQWLPALFGQDGESGHIEYRGQIVRVLLRSNSPVEDYRVAEKLFPVYLGTLTEARIQVLLEMDEASTIPVHAESPPNPRPAVVAEIEAEAEVVDAEERREFLGPQRLQPTSEAVVHDFVPLPPVAVVMPTEVVSLASSVAAWPPALNALGLIGQAEAVAQLVTQVRFSRATGRPFPDKLLVGSPGVGKSSLARAIARQLLAEDEILFNGADLRSPAMLVAKLRQRRKLESRPEPIVIKECVIFIDEVHAIGNSVATVLLSAMDDARIASIDNTQYDLSNVVILLATTDPGRLSEAFNSRPDKTYLRPYTLHELAGIVWLHGKGSLEGAELPQDVCYEIAARTRCQPRRAVRTLTQTLIPHFYGVTHSADEDKGDFGRIAGAMSVEAVGGWFDSQEVDKNGLDSQAVNFLSVLKRLGTVSEETLSRALGISN